MRWTWWLLILFLLWQAYSFYHVFNPPSCTSDHCMKPLFDHATQRFDLGLFVLEGEIAQPRQHLQQLHKPFWTRKDLDATLVFEEPLTVPLFPNTRSGNRSLSLVAILVPAENGGLETLMYNDFHGDFAACSVVLTRHMVQTRQEERFLLSASDNQTSAAPPLQPNAVVAHWKPWIKLRYVLDTNQYDAFRGAEYYLPNVYFDELHLTKSSLWPLSSNASRPDPVTLLKFYPTRPGVDRLLQTLAQSVQMMRTQLQFGDTEVDEVLLLLSPDNMYVLALTYTVSMLHVVFATLAFKNEIAFWSGSSNLYGMSRRSVVGNALGSVILFLFLYDSPGTSWIVLGTMLGHALVDSWKVTKILGWSRPLTEAERQTNDIDAVGMKYLWYLLGPLIAAWSVYSLVVYPHRSWYSWFITSAAHGVYGFGFLMMWPQIFVNYKLKSVAHLPWRALTYKIFSTFVDDLFAWIINAPTIHRLATLRDDVVFFVYLYQRFAYRVDLERVNEFGYKAAGDDDNKKVQ